MEEPSGRTGGQEQRNITKIVTTPLSLSLSIYLFCVIEFHVLNL